MRKRYPKNLKKWQEFWEKQRVYKLDEKSKKPIYSIDTPPPTVSGKMHIGHLFSYTHQDIIARFRRMKGENVFYPFGTDDNGLPTERFVEKKKKIDSGKMKKSEFVKICKQTIKEFKPKVVQNWKNIGLSCDFHYSYSTIDKHCQRISQAMFIDLFNKKRAYRKAAPMMWCPTCQTAIAQAELEDKERKSLLVYIKVNVVGTNKYIIFATTRPELLPACVGISVHPTDKRYKKLIGQKVKMPITGAEIEITGDEKTDKNYGSGVVYYCSYGGVECIDWLARHSDAKPINIMGQDGKLNARAGKYVGMTSLRAREKIIRDLTELGAIVKLEKIKHIVNTHERCGADIEFIATKQWFIRYMDLRQEFIKLGKTINWRPEYMRTRYENWIKGLSWDWCVSRQRFFGIPFPVWYCAKCGKVKLAEIKDLPVNPAKSKPKTKCSCGSNKFIPESDVLDTWATSSLTPIIAGELLKNKKIRQGIIPMCLRPQAHDIINTWLFYTLARSRIHFNKAPWENVLISGFVLDSKGEKMSKSKGNIIEPPKEMKKYPVDALRYWSAEAGLGKNLRYEEEELKNGQRLMTKLWNASKFSFSHLKNFKQTEPKRLEPLDKWLLSKLQTTIKNATNYFEQYEFAKAKKEIEEFFWKIFCDNYLELAKHRLYSPKTKIQKISAQYTLYTALFAIIRLWAPIIPYITEEIYQSKFRKFEKSKSLHITEFPKFNEKIVDKEIEKRAGILMDLISAIRKEKSFRGHSLKKEIKNLTICGGKGTAEALADFQEDIKEIGNIGFLGFGNFTFADKGIITVTPSLKIKIVF